MVDGERRYTYRELAARVHRLANALRHMGVSQGDKVAVLSPNSHRMLEAFFAVPQLGAMLTPLNFRLTTPEFAYILEHAETKVVLVDWEYAHQLAPLVDTLKGIKHYVLLRDTEEPTASLPAQDYETVLAAAPSGVPAAGGGGRNRHRHAELYQWHDGTSQRGDADASRLRHERPQLHHLPQRAADRRLSAHPADVSCQWLGRHLGPGRSRGHAGLPAQG